MRYLIILVVLLCGFKIYNSKGQTRFDWFVCCIMLFSSSIILIDKPQMPCHRFFVLSFWLSVIAHNEYKRRKFPLKVPLILYAIGIVIIGIHSPHLNFFYKFYKPFNFILDSYLVMLLGFYGIKDETFYSKKIVNTLLFVTLYGAFSFVTHIDPIRQFLFLAFDKVYLTDYYFGERTRIGSTWSHPIAYGLICSALFYVYLRYVTKSNKIKLLLGLLAFNVLISGSRTALAAFLLMGGIILMMQYKMTRRIQLIIGVATLSVVIYMTVPIVQEKINSVFLVAMGDDSLGGSSLEMRRMQTEATMLVVAQSPIWGNGIDYITEVMKYNTDFFVGDAQLFGFESYVYKILIENGFVGIFLEIFMLCAILFYAIKNIKKDRVESALICALVLGFTFFAVATGTLDTFIPIMFLVGVSMSKIQIKDLAVK